MLRWLGAPRDAPDLAGVLYGGNSGARAEVPYLDGLVGRPGARAQRSAMRHNIDEGALAYPESASLPSGATSVLRTHDECPANVATAPEPGFPEGVYRTSWSVRRLSSDADTRS